MLKELLHKYGLNRRQAALRSGIPVPLIYRWCRPDGRKGNPRLSSLQKLAAGTGIPLEEIMETLVEEQDVAVSL